MTARLRATIPAFSLMAVGLLGLAAALPPYVPAGGLGAVGPDVASSCATPQAYGYGGTAAGTSTSYHRYVVGAGIRAIDACLGLAGVAPFAGCAVAAAQVDVATGAAQILTLTPGGIFAGVGSATSGATDLYQQDCGGLVGTGSDGEAEFGLSAAALNVRRGSGVEPVVILGTIWGGVPGGDGVAACVGPLATAHHANDTTVFVEDLVMGGAIGFTLAADWGRPAGLSDDNADQNNRAGIPHCGDNVVEPCEIDGHAGLKNDVLFHGGAGAILVDVTHIAAVPPVTSTGLLHALDVVFGCNPLDVVAYQPPAPVGSAVNALNPPGLTLSSFGNGGAAGYLLVLLDTGTHATATLNPGDLTTVSLPTAGWVWSGA